MATGGTTPSCNVRAGGSTISGSIYFYCLECLQKRHKPLRRRVGTELREDSTDAIRPNQCWSMDFMAYELFDDRRLRLLTIVESLVVLVPL